MFKEYWNGLHDHLIFFSMHTAITNATHFLNMPCNMIFKWNIFKNIKIKYQIFDNVFLDFIYEI